MADPALSHAPKPDGATGVLVLADGSVAWGRGFGATGSAVGEVCFNTAMTGYQEVMTDPSYAGQVVTFTFPHIGNVGTNDEDMESHDVPGAVGCVVREEVTAPANFRSAGTFQQWMEKHGKIGIAGLDTRALTRRIRLSGAPNAVIAHDPAGEFDIPALVARAREWPGLVGMDLARVVTRDAQAAWEGSIWKLGEGFQKIPFASSVVEKPRDSVSTSLDTNGGGVKRPHVVAIDYGAKDNIFRNLVKAGASVTVVPAQTPLETILELKPDGVFLSNGPGDPAATGAYAVPVIQKLLEADVPIFGICLGHQMLGLAAGARTTKMHQGHRGANHPVKRLGDGVVEITSMNHGFAVDNTALPDSVEETHVSLFDGSNCGIAVKGKRAFGVQYHPEASPGPQDSFYLFEKFVGMLGVAAKPQALTPRRVQVILTSKSKKKSEIEANEGQENKLAVLARAKAKSILLQTWEVVPIELVYGLLRSCIWWNTHSSGKPVRAPNFCYRASTSILGREVEFGANHFLAEFLIAHSKPIIAQAVDAALNGFKVEKGPLLVQIKRIVETSVANSNFDLYSSYPSSNGDLVFGAHSVRISDVQDFLLNESGLLEYFR